MSLRLCCVSIVVSHLLLIGMDLTRFHREKTSYHEHGKQQTYYGRYNIGKHNRGQIGSKILGRNNRVGIGRNNISAFPSAYHHKQQLRSRNPQPPTDRQCNRSYRYHRYIDKNAYRTQQHRGKRQSQIDTFLTPKGCFFR